MLAQAFQDAAIEHLIESELAAQAGATGSFLASHPYEGVLIVVGIAELPDMFGVEPTQRKLLYAIAEPGEISMELAKRRWQSGDQATDIPPPGWQWIELYSWIPPLEQTEVVTSGSLPASMHDVPLPLSCDDGYERIESAKGFGTTSGSFFDALASPPASMPSRPPGQAGWHPANRP